MRTEDNTWSKVIDADDTLFADLIAPVVELGGEEVVLRGSVADTFEREWDAVSRLLKWMERFDRQKHAKEVHPYLTLDMAMLLETGNRLTQPRMAKPNVSFEEVSLITRILTMPEGWESCVYISPSSSLTQDVLTHVKASGRFTRSVDDDYYLPASAPQRWNRCHAVEVLFRLARTAINYETGWNSVDLIVGVLQDSLLRMGYRTLTIDDVNWPLLLALFDDIKLPRGRVYNTVASLCGKGRLEVETLRTTMTIRVPLQEVLLCYEMTMSDVVTRNTYNRTLSSFPDDVEPVLFGLSPIFYDSQYVFQPRDMNNFIHSEYALVVPWAHHNIIHSYKTFAGGELTPSHYKTLIRLLDLSLGRETLRRILLSLLHAQRCWFDETTNWSQEHTIAHHLWMGRMQECTVLIQSGVDAQHTHNVNKFLTDREVRPKVESFTTTLEAYMDSVNVEEVNDSIFPPIVVMEDAQEWAK